MLQRLRTKWAEFGADERASFAVMGATLLPLTVACAALAVDIGSISADRRRVQSAADLAAMVAATNISVADNAAATTALQNKLPATAVSKVELGVYTPNPAVAPQARFAKAGAGPNNAVRITMKAETPLYFAKFFTGADHYDVQATATATRSAMASFAVGSRTVGLDNGILNSLLSKMLGANISLSLSDYNSLLSTQIDLFSYWSSVATKLNVTGVSYDSLLSGNAKVGDLIWALQKANSSSNLTSILNSLVGSLGTLTTSTPLSQIAQIGPYSSTLVGQKPATSASVSALDLLSAIAQVANGVNQIPLSASVGLPGIASASVNVAIGQWPQGSSWETIGLPGAYASTAQTRIAVSIQLLGTPAIPLVNVPIYVEVARGKATLNTVSCGYPNVSSSTVTLGVQPGIIDAWIGSPTIAELNNLNYPITPVAGTLVNLGAVTVTGRAHATMGNTTATNVNFSYSDIQQLTKKTVTTTNFTSSLTASLLGDLSVTVNVGPFGLPIPGLASSVAGIIAGATPAIDQLLASVLATLGVGIGQADVWVSGVRCDGAVLVN